MEWNTEQKCVLLGRKLISKIYKIALLQFSVYRVVEEL